MDNNNKHPYRVLLQAVLLTIEHFFQHFRFEIDSKYNLNDEAIIYPHLVIPDTYLCNPDDTNFPQMIIFILGYQCTILILSMFFSFSGISHILRNHDVTLPSRHPVSNIFHVQYSLNVNNNNTGSIVQDDSLVVNLSNHILTPAQYQLLSRGLKFCPNPGEPDISLYQTDLDAFHLRIKRFLHFFRPKKRNDLNESISATQINALDDTLSDKPFRHQMFKKPSDWIPPPMVSLEFFISKNNLDLAECVPHNTGRNNISKAETTALRELARNKNIVIKPADKGGSVVIQNRQAYLDEGFRQLSDVNFYSEQNDDLSLQFHREITTILDEMLENHEIINSCHEYLSDKDIRTAQFYMLPKIHKNREHPPGRPIVSGNGCPTERISKFVDFFLQPGVKTIQSYIKDTSDFLLMLQSLRNTPRGCILATLDVSSLYTNIPNVEGCVAVENLLNTTRGNVTNPSNESLLKLLKKVLTCNNFDFNGKHYLQVSHGH